MNERRKTHQVVVGDVPIGGGAPIPVQSMTTTKTHDVSATLTQIKALEAAGCQIIRVTVPDQQAAAALPAIKREMTVPLVADIHFDYRMALAAVDAGVDKVRINPGNIGSRERVKAVLDKLKNAGLPIRIGVNAGSLEKKLLDQFGFPTAKAMVASARHHIDICHEHDFSDIIVSLKSSDTRLMIEAYRLFSEEFSYPVHLGVTEAGPAVSGTIKSAIGIGTLLVEGIGDTIRVSLTDDPVKEVQAGYEILKSLGLASKGVTIVACPTCGRLEVDLFKIAAEMEERLKNVKTPMSVALMGCAVNGPGEANQTDLGIAFGKGGGLLYYKGQSVGRVREDEAISRLLELVEKFEATEGKD